MRIILEAVVAILVITLLRTIVGTILKGFSDLLRPSSPASSGASSNAGTGSNAQGVPRTDQLKKDPVCGTFIAASTSLSKTLGGETYYFCSPECRDKFRVPQVRPEARKAG